MFSIDKYKYGTKFRSPKSMEGNVSLLSSTHPVSFCVMGVPYLFNLLSLDGHLGCFCSYAITTNNAVTILYVIYFAHVQVYEHDPRNETAKAQKVYAC